MIWSTDEPLPLRLEYENKVHELWSVPEKLKTVIRHLIKERGETDMGSTEKYSLLLCADFRKVGIINMQGMMN